MLGPLEVFDDSGRSVDIGGRQPRVILALLLAARGRPVSPDAIVDAIWGDAPPSSATGTLQSYVSRLRGRLGERSPLGRDDAGYRLDVADEEVDDRRFEALVARGRRLLEAGDAAEAVEVLQDADALWRGPAYGDLDGLDVVVGLTARLEELRLAAAEARVEAELALGRHTQVTGELTALVAANPLRERLRELLALALYRAGRQAEALRAISDAGRVLRDELGIEPSRPLRDLEAAILAQDPAIDHPRAMRSSAPDAAAAGGAAVTTPPVGEGRGLAGRAAAPDGLVGRGNELSQLLATLDEARHEARFIVIEGEPGIGKTRLAEQLRAEAEARGALTAWGRSDEGGAAPALWPWLSPLRTLVDHLDEVPDALAELLAGETPMSAGQAQAVQFDRFEAVAAAIDRVAATQQVVLLLDDLQWADEASLELLGFLAGRLGPGTLLVGTMRDLEVGRNDVLTDALAVIARRRGSRRVALRGLDAVDMAAMLRAASGAPMDDEVLRSIHERAEGNPFYSIELVRLLDEDAGARSDVPRTVGDVIRRRLARLPAETVALLGVAAVVGRDVELGMLARAAEREIDVVLDALDPALVHRLLVEVPDQPAVLRFSHALVREVLLDDLTSLRRARLHLRVADAIEAAGAGVDDAEILAEHLWRAAPVGVGRRAAAALEGAADVAIRRVAYAAAEDLLVKAVQLRRATGTTLEDHEAELLAIARLLEVGRARRYFQGAAGLEVLTRAKDLAERCGQRDQLLDLLWFEWSAYATSSRRGEAGLLAKAYLDLTAADPRPEVQAMGLQVTGVLRWMEGDITASRECLDRTLELLATVPVLPATSEGFEAERRMVSHTFWLFVQAASGTRSVDDVLAAFDGLIDAQDDKFAIASICGFAATTAIVMGRWAEADRYAASSQQADPGSQFAFWGGQSLMQQGIALAWRGRTDDAVEAFAEGRTRYTTIGGRSGLPTFGASLALHLAEHGRVAEAEVLVGEARQLLDELREGWNEPIVALTEAVVAHLQGDGHRAAERFEHAEQVATEQGAHAVAERVRQARATLDGV